ncbi:IS1634 family transposase [Patescibacteria group bacterium]|jgi:transposase|nr:IS1634 family transposase [Patescibacteria group bacterium]
MTSERVEISSERVDDIPVIVEWLKQMEIAKWIDQKLSQPHGNRKGLSYGQLSVLLLTYMMTQADHRLCAAEAWVKSHRQSLELTTGWLIREKDVTDDRLARVVEEFGKQEEACRQIEVKLGQHLIRAYELPTEVARADTTSFSVQHQQGEADQQSLLRHGYSKDKRPDLLQYRQLLATLDPAGIPLVSATLPGNGADDPLYWPTWQRMTQVIGHKHFVFLADCKAAAISTRAQIASKGGVYCFPVPMSGQHPLWLKQWVLDPPSPSREIRLSKPDADETAVGKGFDVELGQFWFNPHTQKWVRWHERYLVVYSPSLATAQIRGQQQRLEQAQTALEKLAANPGKELEQLNLKLEAILNRHRVREFFSVTLTSEVRSQNRYVGRGRPTANSVTEEVTQSQLCLQLERNTNAIEEAKQLAGWRLYVTNAPISQLSLPQAVIYYRDEWLVERGFHRFKRGRLPALPIYFQNQHRIAGLMFLLTLALRAFTLIEFVVRQALQRTQQSLAGLYQGNPKRATERPSTEQLLKAFDNLTLYFLPDLNRFMTPLSDLQKQILALMQLPESLYHLHLKQRKT